MLGFADGAELPTHRILVSLSGWGFNPPVFQGCSQVAVLPERSVTTTTICARNYDFSDDDRYSESRLTQIVPERGTATLGTGEFIFGRLEGINAHGLYKGLFFPMIVRACLEMQKNARAAAEFIRCIPHSSTYNFLVADPREAFLVEASPEKVCLREAEDGVLFCTNHYVHPEMAAWQRRVMGNSLQRFRTIEQFLARHRKLGSTELKRLMAGHREAGVCMHRYRFLLGTLWSGIFELGSLTANYAPGPPCCNPWFCIPFARHPKSTATTR